MASRKEQKEKARAERIAREEAERRETSRKRTFQIGGAAAAVVVIAAVVVVLALGGGDGDGSDSGGSKSAQDSVPADATVGIEDTPPPWEPNFTDLTQRIEAMGLPPVGAETFHLHASLRVYVDGKPVPVPMNIGIDPATQTIAALHTHDTEGIVHMEADQEFDFTLGQFMAVWGVAFAKDRLGSLTPTGDEQLEVYLNGKRVSDPVNVVMPEHGNLVIGYGKQGSFPTEPKLNWPPGT